MAIKLADTLAPMADFPAALAEHIQFSDNESLQEKYDNGDLGGGGTADVSIETIKVNGVEQTPVDKVVDITVPTVSNDLTDALKSEYDSAVTEKHTHSNKTTIDKISESSDGTLLFDGNKIEGTVGETGKSAYEIAVENGYVGTEMEWLASLKGERGETGAQGAQGEAGAPNVYSTTETAIGTWNSQTLYRKIFLTSIPSTSANGTQAISTLNIAIDYSKVVNTALMKIYHTGNKIAFSTLSCADWNTPFAYISGTTATLSNSMTLFNGALVFLVVEYIK